MINVDVIDEPNRNSTQSRDLIHKELVFSYRWTRRTQDNRADIALILYQFWADFTPFRPKTDTTGLSLDS